ncbi:hypothetical protein D8674_006233 [Pyrus ussuriensis x Pyrus communis]|uniref:RNase H type-1 domain-containing protein n=1 Tax=Pyrus ussuriensis x Pyrus communis TaxID=2448454 RepID=A0A5N5FTQ9_9ROSA|nr:hypothetical protein D8674_006233 [Pyrus ussuriensis x Pyrus communis]
MMAARDAALFAKEWQFLALVLEGDTMLVMPGLKTEWKVEFSGWVTNKVAHRLARVSLSYGNTVAWFEETPDAILDLLFEDSNS